MFKQRKHLALLLAIVLLLSSVPALAVSPGGGLTLGNSPINSLNGGPMVRDGDTLIWTSPTGIYADGVRLTTEAGRHLNVMGRGLYFTVGTDSPALRRYDLTRGETETLFTWDAPIDQLFITGDNRALLLSGGQVHRVNLGDGNIAADVTAFSVTRFIPTAYGTIYATGDLGNYTLFAGDSLIEADVTIFFTEGDLLILRRGITDYAIPIQTLFTGGQIALSAYQPLAAPLAIEALTSTGECCPICLEGLWEDEFPITQLAAVPTQSLPLTQSQENVVLRARQMSEIRWTPLQNITGWRGNHIYRAGNTYYGLPYAQPVTRGRWVPWQASLSTFADAVRDINSVMYTSFSFHGTHATRAPYFGVDCSSFVSWALDFSVRSHTGTIPLRAHRVATQNIFALQVGDIFNSPSHSLLVTAVEHDAAGNLVAVETRDQTIPFPRWNRYGAGGNSGGLDALVRRTFDRGFALYRSNTIDNVRFIPDPAVDVGLGPRHTVTASADFGGHINPTGPIPVIEGENLTLNIYPSRGFGIARVLVNGVDVGPLPRFTFYDVTEDHYIEVEFALTGSPFDDVGQADWFFPEIMYVFREDLMRGTSYTHFSPYSTTNRAMFITILARMAGVEARDFAHTGTVAGSSVHVRSGPGTGYASLGLLPRDRAVQIVGSSADWYRIVHGGWYGYMRNDLVVSQYGTFSDVTPGSFYAPYAEWAYSQGIVGNPAGRFYPGQVLPRQEMATFLYRHAVAAGIQLDNNNAPPFSDLDSADDWARAGITAMQRAGIIGGVGDNRFDPFSRTNRAQVAAVIARFHERYGHL